MANIDSSFGPSMLYSGSRGTSLVSDEFNQMCVDYRVEATIQVQPNPGNPQKAMRLITFRSFNTETVAIIQSNNKVQLIPSKGTAQVMLVSDEPLPKLDKLERIQE